MRILFWGSAATFLTWLFTSQAEKQVAASIPQTTKPKPTGNYKSDFVAKIWDAAVAQAAANGWSRDALITQAAEESDWGRSLLAATYNNIFGFKADDSWKVAGKPFVNLPTSEYVNGVYTKTNADFRVYNSWNDSVADLIRLLSSYPRYATVKAEALKLGQGQGNLTAYFKALKDSGYNTDKNYDSTLNNFYADARQYLVA